MKLCVLFIMECLMILFLQLLTLDVLVEYTEHWCVLGLSLILYKLSDISHYCERSLYGWQHVQDRVG